MGTLDQVFRKSRAEGRLALMPFVPAGYPSLPATAALLPALAGAGADVIEIGIPFSDPIADGPVIQEAFSTALAAGVHVQDVLRTVRDVRGRVSAPLVAMVSFSIVFRRGVSRFSAEAREAGFDGLIIPDLPPPEAHQVCGLIRAAGLETVLLVAPSTPPGRRAQIAELSSGFLYYLSVAGTTGERTALPADLMSALAGLREVTDKPVCVGFGVSRREHLAALRGHADGAIVGSALVRRLRECGDTPKLVAQAASAFCKDLLS